MKKSLVLLGSLLFVFSATCSANILLYDTFADGSRLETNLPNESAFWASSAGDVTTSVGTVALDMGSASRRMHTYFAPAGSPVSLGVGEQLKATIVISASGYFSDSTSRNFRLGLFYDPDGTQGLADGLTDGGGSGNPWTNATGFNAQFSLSSSETSANARVGKRTDLTNTSLLGSDGAYTYAPNGDKVTNLSLGTYYTITMLVDYKAVDLMEVTFTFSQGNTVLASASLVDDGTFGGKPMYTDFDFLLFRFSSESGTADIVNFHSIKIEHIIPEPATIVLLGLGALASLRRRLR